MKINLMKEQKVWIILVDEVVIDGIIYKFYPLISLESKFRCFMKVLFQKIKKFFKKVYREIYNLCLMQMEARYSRYTFYDEKNQENT
ncbi:MAG: hypothetical protein BAJALOKI2v1_660014 [Promethearchaeota archaeon]|nr:MAG: hypothetical protein BAJALOKI2v1_660014 [Candidatus Lokiarchaeota archaeon]